MSYKIFPLTTVICMILGCASAGNRPPTLLEKVELNYPSEARAEALEGSVELHLLVSNSGDVAQTRISKSSGYEILDRAAIAYTSGLKFDPARRNDEPAGVTLSWLVNYKSVDVYFIPLVYVTDVQNLINLADQTTSDDKNSIQQKIIYAHED